MSRDSIVYAKCRRFAGRICRLHEYLRKERGEGVVSSQVVRSGTSIGANIAEALYASSRKDFINKATIALKECSETHYWLDVLADCGYLDEKAAGSIIEDCEELLKMLVATCKNAREQLHGAYEVRETSDNDDFVNPLTEGDLS